MFLIIGLGNPGSQYVNNRHNIGFKIIDSLAISLDFSLQNYKYKFNAEYTRINFNFLDLHLKENNSDIELNYKSSNLIKTNSISKKKPFKKDLILIKPLTFMNNSGIAVLKFFNYYKDNIEGILVIHDDTDINFGFLKFKHNGSSGGHKGLESIIKSLNSNKFDRLRFGVGKPQLNIDLADYVLSDFSGNEMKVLNLLIDLAVDSIKKYIIFGIEHVMNFYNKKNLLL